METMKSRLEQVVSRKKRTKSQLSELKNRYIAIIYGGVCRGDSLKAIHKRLFDETISRKKKGDAISESMLKTAVAIASYVGKRSKSESAIVADVSGRYGLEKPSLSVAMGIYVFDMLKKRKADERMRRSIIRDADRQEGEDKKRILDSPMPKVGEDPLGLRIFYLASSHKDSASDHAPYQGKMYIDERWRSMPIPPEISSAVSYYVKSHGVKTMQWVTGKPVWFITRPNCRHYFMQLSIGEVLGSSRSRLLEKYDMRTAIGDRQYLQTIKHSTSKDWYEEVRNAELLIERYRERLDMHKGMYRENPCPTLKSAIEKDKMLIDKWEEYVASRKKSG